MRYEDDDEPQENVVPIRHRLVIPSLFALALIVLGIAVAVLVTELSR